MKPRPSVCEETGKVIHPTWRAARRALSRAEERLGKGAVKIYQGDCGHIHLARHKLDTRLANLRRRGPGGRA